MDFKYELQKISATETMTTDTRTITWSNTYKAQPGQTVYCKAWATVGTFDSDYTSMVSIDIVVASDRWLIYDLDDSYA